MLGRRFAQADTARLARLTASHYGDAVLAYERMVLDKLDEGDAAIWEPNDGVLVPRPSASTSARPR